MSISFAARFSCYLSVVKPLNSFHRQHRIYQTIKRFGTMTPINSVPYCVFIHLDTHLIVSTPARGRTEPCGLGNRRASTTPQGPYCFGFGCPDVTIQDKMEIIHISIFVPTNTNPRIAQNNTKYDTANGSCPSSIR